MGKFPKPLGAKRILPSPTIRRSVVKMRMPIPLQVNGVVGCDNPQVVKAVHKINTDQGSVWGSRHLTRYSANHPAWMLKSW